jgi:organic hydroperoxide reductase OsmC/OhrA
MIPLPHRYLASAASTSEDGVRLASGSLPLLDTASPAEFGGPGDRWSPETLLVGALADCFVLTFRAIARASGLRWVSLNCDADGTLDRIERAMQFTTFSLRVRLVVPEGTDLALAERLLRKAETGCLIASSLKGPCHLDAAIEIAANAAA